MALLRWRLWLVVLTGGVVLAIVAAVIVNPQLTRYVESQAFREELDRQTSRGYTFTGNTKRSNGPACLRHGRRASQAATE